MTTRTRDQQHPIGHVGDVDVTRRAAAEMEVDKLARRPAQAEVADQRAAGSGAADAACYSVLTVASRVNRQEAELRRLRRELDAADPDSSVRRHLVDQVALLEQEVALWSGVRAVQIADGDAVQIRGHRYREHADDTPGARRDALAVVQERARSDDLGLWSLDTCAGRVGP